MSVSSTSNKAQFNCNGAQTVFPFTFPIFNKATDLKVYLRSSAGVVTKLTYTTDYSVSATNNDFSSGGNVTTVQTYAAGYTITILRSLTINQLTDYVELDPFPAETHERAIDKLTLICQQLDEQQARQLVGNVTDEPSDMELPSKIDRALKYGAYDADGKPIAVAGGAGQYPVTTFMATMLDDINAAQARYTLGVAAKGDVILNNAPSQLLTGDLSMIGSLSLTGLLNPTTLYRYQIPTVIVNAGDTNFHTLHSVNDLTLGLTNGVYLVQITAHGGTLQGTAPNQGVDGTSAGVCLVLTGKTFANNPMYFTHIAIVSKAVTNFDFQISGTDLQGKITAGNNQAIMSSATIIASFGHRPHIGY